MNLTEQEKQRAEILLAQGVSAKDIATAIKKQRSFEETNIAGPKASATDFGIGVLQSGGKTLSAIKDIGEFAYKPFGYVAEEAAVLARAKLKGISSEQAREEVTTFEEGKDIQRAEQDATIEETLRAKNASQAAGQIGGEIAQLAIPVTKISKGATYLGKAVGGGFKGLATRSAVEGTGLATLDALYQGEVDERTATSFAIGAAFPVAGSIFGKLKPSALKPTGIKDIFKKKPAVAPTTETATKTVADDIVKVADDSLDKARGKTAELLQSGQKKNELGRLEKYSKSDIEATKVIGESTGDLKNFQDLVEEFNKVKVSKIKDRDSLFSNFSNYKVVGEGYLKDVKDKVLGFLKTGEKDLASKYNKVLNKEVEFFKREAKQSPQGKLTLSTLRDRNKYYNKEVAKLYDSVGGKADLLPEDKIRLQVLEDLRANTKKYIDDIVGDEYAGLGTELAGVSNAENLLQIQRGRAKNALKDIPWEDMSVKERLIYIKDQLPQLKDLGRGNLQMLDTKTKLLDELVSVNVRQIRDNYQKSLIR